MNRFFLETKKIGWKLVGDAINAQKLFDIGRINSNGKFEPIEMVSYNIGLYSTSNKALSKICHFGM